MWRIAIVCVFVLAACGRTEVDVQVVDSSEATALYIQQATQRPNADEFLLYEDEQSGIYFHYPAAWQVQAERGMITVIGDGVQIMIEHETFMPDSDIAPTDSPADVESASADGEFVRILGDLHRVYVEATVSADTTAQRLYYTNPDEAAPLTVANIKLAIWLEVNSWPPTSLSRQLADKVVESLGFRWLVTRPSPDQLADWDHFTDEATGLQFDYPLDWQVTRDPDAVVVSGPDARLILALRGGPSGLPAGELRKGDSSHIWLNSTAVPRVHLMYDEQIKAVYYGPPITPIAIGEHSLVISVVGIDSIPYETLDLAPETLRQMDWIVTTLN